MRYIGNKENILDKIYSILTENGVEGDSFFDFFSGTTSVARYYKKLGYRVFSSDFLYLSFCLQKAYIENNREPLFERLLPTLLSVRCASFFASPLEQVVAYLNTISPVKGFIYKNYTPEGTAALDRPRMYFSSENGKVIDAIRIQIEKWKIEDLITDSEYYILLACLIETVSFYANVAGVYAAFQKKWDPRAVKPLTLRPIEIIDNDRDNKVYNANSLDLVPDIDVDILYVDPPYNGRQYLPNYHLLETIAKYDAPSIHGVTGMRDYESKKSSFCNAKTALQGIDYIASSAKYKYLVLSYNSEGIMGKADIMSTLSKYGTVKLEEFEYLRFKSNNNGLAKTQKHVFEQLYILKK
mgnify:FL=1